MSIGHEERELPLAALDALHYYTALLSNETQQCLLLLVCMSRLYMEKHKESITRGTAHDPPLCLII